MVGQFRTPASAALILATTVAVLARCAHGERGKPSGHEKSAKTAVVSTNDTVAGKVMAVGWGMSANGRRVFMQGREPVLIRDGHFSFDRVPPTYDVWVANPSGDTISIYKGLTRRDPTLWFSDDHTSALDDPPHRATIKGILRGDIPFPVELGYLVNLYYSADRAKGFLQVGHFSESGGPRFGPMKLAWKGEPSVSGFLVALGEHATKDQRWVGAFLASKPLVVTAGDEARAELKLVPIPTGHIAGAIDTYHLDLVREIYFGYHVPNTSGEIGIGNCPVLKTFECELPDLGSLGGEYCATINFSYFDTTGTARRCGGKIGMTDFSLHVGAPPRFQERGKSSTVTKDSLLAWTDKEKGVYMVDLGPDSRRFPSPGREVPDRSEIHLPSLTAVALCIRR